jgi:hypothetical protein
VENAEESDQDSQKLLEINSQNLEDNDSISLQSNNRSRS